MCKSYLKRLPLWLSILAMGILHHGYAQLPPLLKQEVHYRIKNHINPSIAIGFTDSTGTHYLVDGWRDLQQQHKADQQTVYELGAITKVYTGLLLAQLVAERELCLETAANALLPDSIPLVDRNGTAIQLEHLATHTAGLAQLPSNITSQDARNPFKDYQTKDLYAFLKTITPRSIGQRLQYSNVGYALLGDLLARYKQTTFDSLLQNELLSPLGLKQTYIHIPKKATSQLATGYLGTQKVPYWDFKALLPAGGLKASIGDLQKFARYFIKDSTAFSKATSLATQSYFKDRRQNGVGLGWFIDKQGVLYHAGGTGGFRSFIAIDKAHKKVVTILTNSGGSPVEDLGWYLINPNLYPLEIDQEEVEISEVDLNHYTGEYINDGLQLHLQLRLQQGHLYAKLNDQEELPLYYQGGNVFIYKRIKARLIFEKDAQKRIVGLLLHQNGQEIQFIKTDPES